MNPHGAVVLMNVISTSYMAEKYIWHRKPATHELPQIRSISDIAWGMWNRAGPNSVKDIKYLLVTQIVNPRTREIITQAYRTLSPPKSEHEYWPGIEFAMDSTGGQAILGEHTTLSSLAVINIANGILGSPVGRWTGYFLMQHKNQLGGNRFLSKVRVFKNEKGSLPYLVFYVEPTPATGSAQPIASFDLKFGWRNENLVEPFEDTETWRIRERNKSDKNMVREHIIQVKL